MRNNCLEAINPIKLDSKPGLQFLFFLILRRFVPLFLHLFDLASWLNHRILLLRLIWFSKNREIHPWSVEFGWSWAEDRHRQELIHFTKEKIKSNKFLFFFSDRRKKEGSFLNCQGGSLIPFCFLCLWVNKVPLGVFIAAKDEINGTQARQVSMSSEMSICD